MFSPIKLFVFEGNTSIQFSSPFSKMGVLRRSLILRLNFQATSAPTVVFPENLLLLLLLRRLVNILFKISFLRSVPLKFGFFSDESRIFLKKVTMIWAFLFLSEQSIKICWIYRILPKHIYNLYCFLDHNRSKLVYLNSNSHQKNKHRFFGNLNFFWWFDIKFIYKSFDRFTWLFCGYIDCSLSHLWALESFMNKFRGLKVLFQYNARSYIRTSYWPFRGVFSYGFRI